MFPHISMMTARVLQDERIREAEQYRQTATARVPHQLRHRVGTGLIHLGRAMAEEPAERPARARLV